MNDTTRTVLIALGIGLLVIVLVPLLFMAGMMGAMAGGVGGMMNGGGTMILGGAVLLILIAAIILIAIGVGRRR